MSVCKMARELVGTLSIRARKRDVESFLREYGGIRELSLNDGSGFVEFDDLRDAEKVLEDLNGKILLGERASSESERDQLPNFGAGRGKGRRFGALRFVQTGHRVVVENLTTRTNWKDLKDYFRKAGNVTYTDVHKKGIGKGVVEFSTRDGVLTAIKTLNETELDGRKIKLTDEKKYVYSSPSKRSPTKRLHSPSRSNSHSPKKKQLITHSYSLRRRPRSSSPKAGTSVKAKLQKIKTSSKRQSQSRLLPRLTSQTSRKQSHSNVSSKLHSWSRSLSRSSKRKDTSSRAEKCS